MHNACVLGVNISLIASIMLYQQGNTGERGPPGPTGSPVRLCFYFQGIMQPKNYINGTEVGGVVVSMLHCTLERHVRVDHCLGSLCYYWFGQHATAVDPG